jgi:hypothetical protein
MPVLPEEVTGTRIDKLHMTLDQARLAAGELQKMGRAEYQVWIEVWIDFILARLEEAVEDLTAIYPSYKKPERLELTELAEEASKFIALRREYETRMREINSHLIARDKYYHAVTINRMLD